MRDQFVSSKFAEINPFSHRKIELRLIFLTSDNEGFFSWIKKNNNKTIKINLILEALQKNSRNQNVKNNLIGTALANSKDSCVHDGKTRKHLESWRETSDHASSVKDGRDCMMCQCYVRKPLA